MAYDDPIITRESAKNFFRGLVKSVPAGDFLEQLIYGTLDEKTAKAEAAKLHAALAQITEKIQGAETDIYKLLEDLPTQADFRQEVIDQLAQIRALLDSSPPSSIPQPLIDAANRILVHNLPYRSIGSLLKGRDGSLDELHSQLSPGSPAAITQPRAIHGLGGIGKTRLAVEYAWRSLSQGLYRACLFVIADSPSSLSSNFAALAAPDILNLPEHNQPDQNLIVSAVTKHLAQRTDWLLIFDNVDSIPAREKLCSDFLPNLSSGRLLITSRLSNWPPSINDIEIRKLPEEDAVSYLLERTESKRSKTADDNPLVKQLARALDGLPIALEHAAAYINRRRISFETYIDDFHDSEKTVLSWHNKALQDYPRPVLAAWNLTWRKLSPISRAILRLSSFLAPEPIPTALFESQPELIQKAAKSSSKKSAAKSKQPPDIRAALAELADWSMLTLTDNTFTLHRLVQDSIRFAIPSSRFKSWLKFALNLVDSFIPADPPPDDVRSWHIWTPFDPHIAAIIKYADNQSVTDPTYRFMNELAVYYQSRARFSDTEPLKRQVVVMLEESLGNEHPIVGTVLNNLAQLLQATNRFDEAEPLMRRALQIDEECFGPNHPHVAIDLNNLAQLLQETNRLDDAEPLMRRALQIDERSFGPNHPKVAIRLNNLAQLLQATNRLADAEPLMRRALQIDEKAFGPNHPDVAIALNNLAGLLQATNRLDEAEPLYRRALQIDEKSFGPNHPRVALALNNLAALLRATNRLGEAEPLMRRALQIDEKPFGPNHPKVAIRLNNLAQLLQVTNRLDEAGPLYRRALEIFQTSLGPDHPSTITVRKNLNNLLDSLNSAQ